MSRTRSNTKANAIVQLLSIRHAEDVFVSECKTGPTHYAQYGIIDAWVMKKSWAHPLVIGYEIKVDRTDFVTDEKWRQYLNYCNEFYFVCPTGLIEPQELPNDTGLLWVSSTGSKLYRKKKAPYRDIQIPEEIFRYLLMARTRISGENFLPESSKQDKIAFWQNWLEEKELGQNIGYRVSERLNDLISKKIEQVDCENKRLQKRIEQLGHVEKFLKERNITSEWWDFALKRQIENVQKLFPEELEREITDVIRSLQKLVAEIQKTKKGETVDEQKND